MTSYRRSLDLPYRPEDLFDLVVDVRRYPEFVTWVRELSVLREEKTEDRWRGAAKAVIGFGGFSETFTTDIDARADDRAIDVNLVRGPFRKLRNTWRFTSTATGTRIDVLIEFEFRNFLLQALADANRDFAVNRLIHSFVSEAARRYGKVPAPV
ncbi:MAG: type II toxin-antitoxin system RatA family toxin [Alphaproteobacteria bacterium]|nr:type II toxin-antitoxin system RatA family toxin [Alphaproteobacteria bacterium]